VDISIHGVLVTGWVDISTWLCFFFICGWTFQLGGVFFLSVGGHFSLVVFFFYLWVDISAGLCFFLGLGGWTLSNPKMKKN